MTEEHDQVCGVPGCGKKATSEGLVDMNPPGGNEGPKLKVVPLCEGHAKQA
jgi:hypothetical protein